MTQRLPIALGAALGLAVLAGFGVDRMTASPDGEAVVSRRVRWVNTEIELPANSPLSVSRILPRGPKWPQYLISVYFDPEQGAADPTRYALHINAETGAVEGNTLATSHPAEAAAIIASITLVSGPPRVWPYVDSSPPETAKQVTRRGVTYREPPPDAGILVHIVESICYVDDPDCEPVSVLITNGKSASARIVPGRPLSLHPNTASEDATAFQRLSAQITFANE